MMEGTALRRLFVHLLVLLLLACPQGLPPILDSTCSPFLILSNSKHCLLRREVLVSFTNQDLSNVFVIDGLFLWGIRSWRRVGAGSGWLCRVWDRRGHPCGHSDYLVHLGVLLVQMLLLCISQAPLPTSEIVVVVLLPDWSNRITSHFCPCLNEEARLSRW